MTSTNKHVMTRTKILIAEDSATQAQELSFLLEEHGFQIRVARNGVDALKMINEELPDLIISDIIMPEMDGYALCRAVKKTDETSKIPFILVTSLSSPHDVFRGLDVGADNFVVKPYESSLLLSRVNYLLTNRNLRKMGKLQMGIEIELSGQRHFITAERQQILDLLISTYEQAVSLYDALDARQRQLVRSYETLDALYGMADGLNRCHTEAEVGASAVAHGLRLPGVRAGWLYIVRDGAFHLMASMGVPGQIVGESDAGADCHCKKRLATGALASAANITECECLTRLGWPESPRHHASIPLTVGDQIVGLLNLVGSEPRMFSDEELRTLSSVGNQIGVALERAQLQESLERKVKRRTAALQEAGERLREANDELNTILDSTPFAIETLDRERNVLSWNRAAEAMFGYKAEEVVGQPDPLLSQSEVTLEPEGLANISSGIVRGCERTRRHKDGSAIDVRISAAPLYDDTQEIRGQVRILEDLREHRRVEEQLRQAQKMEAIGNLTGGIAHDFNNLLTIVIGNVDMLARLVKNNPAATDLAEGALGACLRGAELTRQLLAFGRRQTLTPEIVDVNRLVRGMVKLLSRTLGEQVKIELVEGEGVWPVVVDAAQLDAAIVNLSVNARDAMPDGGRLTIETRNVSVDDSFVETHPGLKSGDFVVASVTDTGIGIQPEMLSRIFEPFFTTKEVNKGTGLGLAMVYGFVRQSDGYVTVYSEVGNGTAFRLYLPRALEPQQSAPLEREYVARAVARGGERILVVEDNEGVRQMVVRQLKELGFDVRAVSDGSLALAEIEKDEKIDLVFSDVVMPGEINGISLAAMIKKRWPNIKVLLTSGFPEAALSRANGNNKARILSKPYRVDQLSHAIAELLDS